MYCLLPGAGLTSSGHSQPSGSTVSCVTGIHSSPIMSAAYSLLKKVGFSTQAPAKPEDSVWHRPYTWPPQSSATASWSLRPILPNTSRMCCARFSHPTMRPSSSTCQSGVRPLSAPGRRPGATACSAGRSVRPPVNLILGPPVCSMATYAAKIHRSAQESQGCFSLTGSSSSRAWPRPAFSGSPASKACRIVAPLEPPVPSALQ
mmetsp:Transcript_4318/g.11562  ORF Transcript_4318/g.11562 Transcript_4318/m.11562 type:complete len:204 (-) Transcript_4318:425-1036(-)